MQICGFGARMQQMTNLLCVFLSRAIVAISLGCRENATDREQLTVSLEYALTFGYCLEKAYVNKQSQMGVF